MRGVSVAAIVLGLAVTAWGQSRPAAQTQPASAPAIEGPYFGERITAYRFEPEVSVHINAPGAEYFDPAKPTRLILYTLPNGNTTAETIGRKRAAGADWHYGIQHIGAQVRRLREAARECNWVVAYLEADGKSWPAWKGRHKDYRELIPRIVADVVKKVGPERRPIVYLTGHSGGGSFVFGYLDSFEQIPAEVERISFLDSNYGYDDDARHGDKLIAWLRGGKERVLSIICYDDRNITLNGELVVGPTGGTWRKTERMIARLKQDVELSEKPMEGLVHLSGLDGRIDILMHPNPKNAILHTALVGDMSGFIYAMTVASPFEGKAGRFGGPVAYEKWIQP